MKAFVVDKYKNKGALRLASVPEPKVQDGDVMIRVHAAAVNLLDSKVRDGEFKLLLPYQLPFGSGPILSPLSSKAASPPTGTTSGGNSRISNGALRRSRSASTK